MRLESRGDARMMAVAISAATPVVMTSPEFLTNAAAHPRHRRRVQAALAFTLALFGTTAGAQTGASPLLKSAAEVRQLPPMEALGKTPRRVRLSGVVLAVNASRSTLYLHDGTGGIGVLLKPQTDCPAPGKAVVIEGRAVLHRIAGFSHTRVQAETITVEGQRPLPEPARIDIPTLNSFANHDQWVSVEGHVMTWRHAGSTLSIKVVDDRDMSTAHVHLENAAQIPPLLIGARLRLTGVNTGDHTAANALAVPDLAQVEALTPGHAGVFDAPQVSFRDVTSRKLEAGKRFRVQGEVAALSGRSHLYLKSSDGALTCQLDQRTNDPRPGVLHGDAGPLPEVAPGDQVEVVGSAIGTEAGLRWSQVRVTGKGTVPRPEATNIRTLQSFADMDHWVTLEGVVHAWTSSEAQTLLACSDATGSINVLVRECPPQALPKDLFGARLRLTGMSQLLARGTGAAPLEVPDLSFLEILKPGSADPFEAPDTSLANLRDQRVPVIERVRTRGIITGLNGRSVYLRDEGSAAARVLLQPPWPRLEGNPEGMIFADAGPPPSLAPGDEVEVVGTPLRHAGDAEASLHDLVHASVRVLGRHVPPEPVDAPLPDIARGLHDADRVRTRGRLIRLQTTPLATGEWRFELQLEADGAQLSVICPTRNTAAFATLKLDDEVIVQGLVNRAAGSEPRNLWLPAAEEARSMGLAPAVRRRQLLVLAGGAAIALGVLGAWVLLLLRNQRLQRAAARELKAAAEAAHASEQRWQLLFEQSPLSVQIFAPDGRTKRFNNAWRRLFRLSDAEGLAFNVLEAPDLVASGAVEHIRKAFAGEVVEVPPVPFSVPSDPPEVRWIGGLLYPLKNDTGEILEVVVIHHDITETRRAEEAMRALNQTLEQRVADRTQELHAAQADLARALAQERELGELKSRFVNLVSHEFRTPLGIIMSAIELMRHYGDRLPGEQQEELQRDIFDATRHMAGLMEQVLVLGRVEAGKLGCKAVRCDLHALAGKLIVECLSAGGHKCPIGWQPQGDLSGARADAALLRHIFGNLLGNAVKYSPAGREVQFRARREGSEVVFEVTDSGIGIPAADREHLFEAFHRCSNVGDIPGSGLGLVIVKRCVDLHGGTLELDSEPGRGTTFTVRLPLFADGST